MKTTAVLLTLIGQALWTARASAEPQSRDIVFVEDEEAVTADYSDSSVYDYYYYGAVSNAVLKKCFCAREEVWVRSDGCELGNITNAPVDYEELTNVTIEVGRAECADSFRFFSLHHSIISLMNSVHQYPNASGDFCLERYSAKQSNQEEWLLEHCVPQEIFDCPRSGQCQFIRRLCSQGYLYNMESRQCDLDSKNLTQDLLKFEDEVVSLEDFRMYAGRPNCTSVYKQEEGVGKDFRIIANGSLHFKMYRDTIVVPSQTYVLEILKDSSGERKAAIICFPEKEEASSKQQCLQEYIHPSLLCVSSVFLLMTIVVYSTVTELQSKINGKCLLSHVFSLLVTYVSLTVVQWGSHLLIWPVCVGMGILIQFSSLSTFFWLNVLCFDVWWTLRSLSSCQEDRHSSKKRFRRYCIYAWGGPTIISIVTIVMQLLPDSIDKSSLILPQLGHKGCALEDYESKWVYLYGFILLLNCIDIFFFVDVTLFLVVEKRLNSLVYSNNNHNHKERYLLHLKLFAIMGVTWIFEVISWLHGNCKIWIIFDVFNILRGPLIFFMFIYNRKVIEKIQERFISILCLKDKTALSASPRTSQCNISDRKDSQTGPYHCMKPVHSPQDPASNPL